MPEHALTILALFELGCRADIPNQGVTEVGARDGKRNATIVVDGRELSLHTPVVA